jgi:hypothetical protein
MTSPVTLELTAGASAIDASSVVDSERSGNR